MERGQATTEYVGVIALVALTLTLAGAVAAPDLPRTLARHFRLGLCLAGGDVCRAADARAQGLAPCVLRVSSGRRRTGVNVAVVSYGRERGFAIERRSDGTRRVVVTAGDEGGLTAAVGVTLGAQVDVGAEVGGSLGFVSGAAWELRDEAALKRFLKGVRPGPELLQQRIMRGGVPRPTERYRGGSGSLGASAGLTVLGLEQPGGKAGGRGMLGRRTRGGRTSWFFDASHAGAAVLGGLLPEVELARSRAWVLELSDRPRALRLQTTLPGENQTQVEVEAQLDLTVPANAAVVRDLLGRPSRARARAIGRHMLTAGTVERRVYRVRELPGDPEIAVKLGFAGAQLEGSGEERTLVAAEVLRDGGSARRADCLGL